MKKISLLALSLVVGCTTGVVEPRLDEQFALQPGESARVVNARVTVSFSDVTQDSRCPTRAQCVWAGDGVVQLDIATLGSGTATVELHTNRQFEYTYQLIDGVVLELVGLDPYPEIPDQIDAGSYEITLIARAPARSSRQ